MDTRVTKVLAPWLNIIVQLASLQPQLRAAISLRQRYYYQRAKEPGH